MSSIISHEENESPNIFPFIDRYKIPIINPKSKPLFAPSGTESETEVAHSNSMILTTGLNFNKEI